MSRDNVKRVLVTKGNKAVAAKGTKPDALTLGQIGVFDANTNLAIDATQTPKEFYIAVGIDSNFDGVVNDIAESAGQVIQSANLRGLSYRPHTASRPMIVELDGLTDANVEVGKEFAIKLELRNQRIYRLQGTNAFTTTYAVTAEVATAASVIQLLADAVNANESAFVSAAVVGGKLQLTTKPLHVNKAVNLNLLYNDLRETVVIPSLAEGFPATASFTTIQQVSFEEGDGAQVRQKEFNITGDAKPYVLSDSTGTARDIDYRAEGGVKYDQMVLEYDQFSVAGWLEHLNNLQTTIAIPATDTVTIDGLVPIIDAQFAAQGFAGVSDVATQASVDPEVVEPSNDPTVDLP